MVRGIPDRAPGSAGPVITFKSMQKKEKDLKQNEKTKYYTLNLNCTFFNWLNILSELYDVLSMFVLI